jgi:hypothetical protein
MIADPQDFQNSAENESIQSLNNLIRQKDGEVAALT